MKKGIAGSKQSSDCYCIVTDKQPQQILIDSVVGAFFHDQMLKVIHNTLHECGKDNLSVELIDRGALDSTIKSRLLTAIERMKEDE